MAFSSGTHRHQPPSWLFYVDRAGKGKINTYFKVSPSQEVVVICMTGHRSPLVAYALKKKGYVRVYNLIWGMAGWKMWEWISQLRSN